MFMDHINEFGIGMLVFPSIVKQLNGEYFMVNNDNDDQKMKETMTKMN